MKAPHSILPVLASVALAACASAVTETVAYDQATSVTLHRAPPVSDTVDGVIWRVGDWEPHLAAGSEGTSWGNHRAVVRVSSEGSSPEAVLAMIPWRRSDLDPAAKSVVVVDASTGVPVANAFADTVENPAGNVIFQPNAGSNVYHVYYLPWQSTGGYYPTVTYPSDIAPLPDSAWVARVEANRRSLPRGLTTHIESVDAFHSFFPMELIATPTETAAFMAEAPQGWRLVAEHRDRPVRMRRFIPHHWANRPSTQPFTSRVLRDESFTFQVALVAGEETLEDVRVEFRDFPVSWADAWTCFNCEGRDEMGALIRHEINVPAATVQALWLGIRIPADQSPGEVHGSVTVSSTNLGQQTVPVVLEVRNGDARNGGADEPELMTRLGWLNSAAGTLPDFIVAPFEPVEAEGHALSILGRSLRLGESGLPSVIASHFTPDVTGLAPDPQPILARPLAVEVVVAGESEVFRSEDYSVDRPARGRAEWTARSTSDRFRMTVAGALEYDGMLDIRLTLVARQDVSVDDIALPVHYAPGAAEYMLGLGRTGGRRPTEVDWKWAVENHQEGVWLGGVNRGLQYVLRDRNYVRPLNTNFYRDQPLRMPPSWFNDGRGGITIREDDGIVVARNYSGARTVAAGDSLHFNIRFLITPFKPIDTQTHFNTRFVHQYVPVDSVQAWGGTVVNIHHANEINPYINYPFFNLEAQAAYITEAHEKGIKVKLYNTIREITYKAHELFVLRSLGHEILNGGEGGGHSWLQEHLVDDYHSAWHAWRVDDAAVLDRGTSRRTNYYVEGIQWLAENQHIDGLYLDDIAYSRATVKRLATVLQQNRPDVVIDLHSANQFNERDGFTNSAMLYMEHFPFISRLWFGEYFDYDQGPDYWMTEVAGLPFGLMGEMLQDGGHPYRGMLYGMTARKYGSVDPRPVWGMMNEFGIAGSRMLGYWLDDAPVQTGRDDILATTYVLPGSVLIALASWSDSDQQVRLSLDREALGLGAEAAARAPGVDGLQEADDVDLSAVSVPAGQGLWIVVADN